MHSHSRSNPFFSKLKQRDLLTRSSSTKKTYHIVLDSSGLEDVCKVGDSVAIFPSNDEREVETILSLIQSNGSEMVFDSRVNSQISIYDFLLNKANLSFVNRAFIAKLLERGGSRLLLEPLLESENKGKLAEFIHQHTVLELLRMARMTAFDLAELLLPLLPRFYSIANSQKVFPSEFHLLVKYVKYEMNGQTRCGVGSHFLVDLAKEGETKIPLYVQPSSHFTLPKEKDASIILVGPGTGVAPYRAFLQERIATQSTGLNWLFFGERNRHSDFYYEDYWKELESLGRLRLDVAFSRDGNEKTYVQHKMYEQRKSLWSWIQEGALFYVCGDANQMAKDVDAMLQRIVKEEGHYSEEDARSYVKNMRKEKRYLTDVY